MRIVGGEAGGRRLAAPPGRSTRPTSDRVREAMFDVLGSLAPVIGFEMNGATVADLFAGSGALGIEALSRGAGRVAFVDRDDRAVATIRANLSSTRRGPGGPGGRRTPRPRSVMAGPEDETLRQYRCGGRADGGPGRWHVRTALIPGTFDPFHNGHLEVVETASRLFDNVVVAPMRNPQKGESLFTIEERRDMIEESVAHLANVTLETFSSLVVDLARQLRVDIIVKGLRVASDAEAELQQAQMNKAVSGIETLFIPCSSEYSFIASRYVREFARYGGADRIGSMVPGPVFVKLKEKFAR